MSDIAMLVAEEYERRVKNSKKAGGIERQQKPIMSVWAQKMKNKFGKEKMEHVKWALEPKSQIGLAASYGFFSA